MPGPSPFAPRLRNFSINEVKGRTVIDSNGDNVGTIEDVVVDPEDWKVSGFVVSLRREVADLLRMERRGFMDTPRIEIGAERIRTVGENVILNIERDTIAQALRERAAHDEAPREPGSAVDPLYAPTAPPAGPERFDPPPF